MCQECIFVAVFCCFPFSCGCSAAGFAHHQHLFGFAAGAQSEAQRQAVCVMVGMQAPQGGVDPMSLCIV